MAAASPFHPSPRNPGAGHGRYGRHACRHDCRNRGPDQHGPAGECRNALRWLEHMPAPCTVIPGNHDTLVHADWQQTVGLWQPWMGRCPFPSCGGSGLLR
ncbi:metallophosphoesterase [Komagataeibacter rhaeticus]|nr:metallophosphoesterase [Komagataeibacter rhaeticus]